MGAKQLSIVGNHKKLETILIRSRHTTAITLGLQIFLDGNLMKFISVWISGDHGSAPRLEHRLLWLCRPMQDWQTLPQVVQVKGLLDEDGGW